MSGIGPVQFEGNESPLSQLEPLSSETHFKVLAVPHLEAYPNNERLNKAVKETETDLAGLNDMAAQNAYWSLLDEEMARRPTPAVSAKEAQMQDMTLDWLKARGLYKGAANLADKSEDARTARFDVRIYSALVARDLNWIGYQWTHNSFLKNFTPQAFVDTFKDYLFGTTRDIPDLNPNGGFQQQVQAFLDTRGKAGSDGRLAIAEPAFFAAWALQQADQLRVSKMLKFVNEEAPGVATSRLTALQRYNVATRVEEWTQHLPEGKGVDDQPAPVQRIFILLGKAIHDTATLARQYWALVDSASQGLRNGVAIEKLGDMGILFSKELEKEAYRKFRDKLLEGMVSLFAIDEQGDPINAKAYKDAVDKFAKEVRNSAYNNFEKSLLASIKSTTKGGSDLGELAALGVMLNFASQTVEHLDSYSHKEDDDYGKANLYGDKPAADVRIHHRLNMARFLWDLASLLNWEEIRTLSEQVIGARQAGGKQSRLALIGDWKEDKDVKMITLLDDFAADAPISGFKPLRAREVFRFFQTEYFELLNTELEQRIKASGYDLEGLSIVGASNSAALSKLERPRRFSFPTEGIDRAIHEDDTNDIGRLILAHPKTRALISSVQGDKPLAPLHVVPDSVDSASLFIWFFPPLDELIQRYRSLDTFNLLVLEHLQVEDKTVDMPHVKALAAVDWLGRFSAALNAKEIPPQTVPQTSTIPKQIEGIQEMVGTDYASEHQKLLSNLRVASTRDRFERGRGHVLNLLQQYTPRALDKVNPAAGSKVKAEFSLQIPAAVDSMIRNIVYATEPRDDEPLHLAALLLQLAPELTARFGVYPKIEVAALFVPLIDAASKTLGEVPAGVMSSVLSAEEKVDANYLTSRKTQLETLVGDLKVKLAKEQLTYGVMGMKSQDGAQVLKSIGHGFLIKAKEENPFTITDAKTGMQLAWRLISIQQDFVYYPKLGPKAAELWSLNAAGEPDGSLDLGTPLAVVEINGRQHTLTGKSNDYLDMLTFAVTMEVMKRQLDELSELLQQFGELTLDVLEMVPGMQPLIAARLVVAILAFVASPEFEEIKKTVTEDPETVFKGLLEQLLGLVEPATLWEFLLFSDTSILSRLHGKKVEKKVPVKKGGTVQRLMHTINRLFNFGEEVAGDLGRHQTWMRWQAERVEMFVQQRPALNTVLHFIALYFDQIAALVSSIAEYTMADPQHRTEMEKGLADWPETVHEMVLRATDFELPDEVLPMGDLVEGLVELAISRLGAKYKLGAGAVMYLLRLIGKDQEIFDYIGQQIPSAVNPNHYWREYVKKPVGQQLHKASVDFGKAVFDFMASSLKAIDALASEAPRFTRFSENLEADMASRRAKEKTLGEEAQQQPFGWRRGHPSPGARPPPGEGVSLSGALKTSSEQWFGQDFGHVRLHRDSAAQRYTGAAKAAAITSGSHVYLGSGIDVGSSMGSHVVRHELAHVVQQTGNRPLGKRWSAGSVAPRRGPGLHFDADLEAQAERAAVRPGGGGLTLASTRAGAQPVTLADLSQRFLSKVTSTVELEAKTELAGAARVDKIPPSIASKLKGFWESYDAALVKLSTQDARFQSAIADVRSHLSDTSSAATGMGKQVKAALHEAVRDAIRETGTEKNDKGEDKPVFKLDRARLAVSLSRRILGLTGIDLDIQLEEQPGKDGPVKVASMLLRYVHLAIVHGMSPLWKHLKTPVDPGLLPTLRAVLYDEGIALGVWVSGVYDLTQRVRDKASKLKTLGNTAVSPSNLPSVAEYTKTDPGSASGPIGLRLGIYNDAGGGSQSAPDRESHHTSQFLLVEYFANQANNGNVPAFPLIAQHPEYYPGVKMKGNVVDTIEGDAPIHIGAMYPQRGGKMPTILLSAAAHRYPGLHMTPDPDDLLNGASSQAGVVKRRFEANLGSYKPLAQSDEASASFAFKLGTPAQVKKAQYDAVLATYRDVWQGRMQKGLKLALLGPERAYYNALAEQRDGGHSGERLTPAMVMTVWAKAVQHNNDLMKSSGGWS